MEKEGTSRRIFLIRHAESSENEKGVMHGKLDASLSKLGERQARRLGKRLSSEGISLILSSPLGRARVTAEEIAKAQRRRPRLVLSKRLVERDFGIMEGRPYSSLSKSEREIHYANPADRRRKYQNGESLLEVERRVLPIVRLLENSRERNVAVVAHSGTLRAIILLLLKISTRHLMGLKMANAAISEISIHPPGRAALSKLNDDSHLRA